MMDEAIWFFLGILIGLGIIANGGYFNLGSEASTMLIECEAELPRDNYCEIQAVPISEERVDE